jgi:arylformamidase
MPIYDITVSITPDMPLWPGQTGVSLERVSRIEAGANSNSSRLSLDVHNGTHVDAPVHFLPGAAGVESLPLDVLVGAARVIHLPRIGIVTAAHLAGADIPARTRRLLIRTRNSRLWAGNVKEFRKDFAALSEDAAGWIVDRGIWLVGVDYLSVAPWKQSRPTHVRLLSAGVVVVEGLNLAGIKPGAYQFACLPLKLVGSDGSPARAVLMR